MTRNITVVRLIAAMACAGWLSGADARAECTICGGAAHVTTGEHGALGPYAASSASEVELGGPTAACTSQFCLYECRTEGVVFAVEQPLVGVLQSRNSDLASDLLSLHSNGAVNTGKIDPGFDPSLRLSVGGQNSDGLGVNVRYWEFDTLAVEAVPIIDPTDPNFARHGVTANVLDVELTLNSYTMYNWDTTLSAGYRFASYEEEASLFQDATTVSSVETTYIGNGVTGRIEGRRQLSPRWNLLLNARPSLLLGSESVSFSGMAPAGAVDQSQFDTRFICESQFGVEYIWPICRGGYFFVRAGGEIQYWDEFASSIRPNDNGHVTFLGGFWSFGLQR